MEEPSEYIKRIMKENGLTSKMFGKKVGKSHRTIEDWTQGRYPPKAATMAMIEKIYGERK